MSIVGSVVLSIERLPKIFGVFNLLPILTAITRHQTKAHNFVTGQSCDMRGRFVLLLRHSLNIIVSFIPSINYGTNWLMVSCHIFFSCKVPILETVQFVESKHN
jgi:hypothetical protein